MEIIFGILFSVTFLVSSVELHKALLAFKGESYKWPFIGGNIFISYPCIVYQIYYWANYLKIVG